MRPTNNQHQQRTDRDRLSLPSSILTLASRLSLSKDSGDGDYAPAEAPRKTRQKIAKMHNLRMQAQAATSFLFLRLRCAAIALREYELRAAFFLCPWTRLLLWLIWLSLRFVRSVPFLHCIRLLQSLSNFYFIFTDSHVFCLCVLCCCVVDVYSMILFCLFSFKKHPVYCYLYSTVSY